MRKRITAIILMATVALSLLVVAAPAAKAHLMWGANCHINTVTAAGRINLKLTNRTYTSATVTVGLRTNDGRTRYFYAYLGPRRYINRWVFLSGNWSSVRITHCHTYG
jgi:hypothetical protein